MVGASPFASTLLVLVCYGAVLRQQLGFAAGERPQVLQSLRDAARDVPFVLLLVAVCTVPFLPAIVATALALASTCWHCC